MLHLSACAVYQRVAGGRVMAAVCNSSKIASSSLYLSVRDPSTRLSRPGNLPARENARHRPFTGKCARGPGNHEKTRTLVSFHEYKWVSRPHHKLPYCELFSWLLSASERQVCNTRIFVTSAPMHLALCLRRRRRKSQLRIPPWPSPPTDETTPSY